MKEFIKKCLTNFSLIVITVFFVFSVKCGEWSQFIFVSQILLLTVTIFIGQILTNKFTSPYHFLETGLELIMVLSLALTYGWFFKWYQLQEIWIMFVIVIPVYIISYILDIARTKKDVEFINDQIKLRKARLENSGEDMK